MRATMTKSEPPNRGTALTLRRYVSLIMIAAGVVALDQIAKAIVSAELRTTSVDILAGSIRLDYVRNTGAAFSIFRAGGEVFAVIAVAVSASILLYYRKVAGSPWPVRCGLGLVLGGAIGNLIDRIRLGYVVDFIDLRWWPVFNLADSAIVIGVGLLAFSSLLLADGLTQR